MWHVCGTSLASWWLVKLGHDVAFEVGREEKHHVEFRWGQFWGLARIWVDGVEVLHERHNFGLSLTRRYEVSVGDVEIHSVAIEKRRPRVNAGLRKQTLLVFVDGDLVAKY